MQVDIFTNEVHGNTVSKTQFNQIVCPYLQKPVSDTDLSVVNFVVNSVNFGSGETDVFSSFPSRLIYGCSMVFKEKGDLNMIPVFYS